MTAETVIEPLEDPEDYKAFEQAVAANYDAESAVERELVLRLASLLWRLRRTTSIETGLMQIEGQIIVGWSKVHTRHPKTVHLRRCFGCANGRPMASLMRIGMEAAATIMHSTILAHTSRRPLPRGSATFNVMSRDTSYVSQISIMVCSAARPL